jgi:hypothetical protein
MQILIQSKQYANSVVSNILAKYKRGLQFVEARWIGDDRLKLNDGFKGKSRYDNDIYTNFVAVANEITIDNGFREITKGKTG